MGNIWYKKYGFSKNPFDWRPNEAVLVGLEGIKKKLINYIDSGDICLLIGETGIGKTSLARYFTSQNPNNYSYLLLDCRDIKDNFNLNKELRKLNKLLIFPSKNKILFLDEFQHLRFDDVERIVSHCEKGKIKSIIAIQISRETNNIPGNVSDKMGNTRVIEMKKLSKQECKELIIQRLDGRKLFDNQAIESIIERNRCIPRRILENCERICIELQDDNKKIITINDIDRYGLIQTTDNIKSNRLKPVASNKQSEIKPKLTKLQLKIVDSLIISDKTTDELAKSLKNPLRSISKQLSLLKKIGAIEVVNENRPKKFGLDIVFKRNLIQE
jgi:energy-coupling factor transporter ATP-binding protein EcfA2